MMPLVGCGCLSDFKPKSEKILTKDWAKRCDAPTPQKKVYAYRTLGKCRFVKNPLLKQDDRLVECR